MGPNWLIRIIDNCKEILANVGLMKKYYGFKTFTYFLPAPTKSRKTGYQEKEFDYISDYLQKLGYDLLDVKTASVSGEVEGIWIICRLGCTKKNLLINEINIDYSEISRYKKQSIEIDPDIIHET